MNIVEKVKSIVENFPKISQLGVIHTDLTGEEPGSCGLSALGDALLSEDILGNQQRQHTFMLHAVFSAVNDFERLSNSGLLLELAQYLDACSGEEITHEIDGVSHNGVITKITTAGGTLSIIPDGTTVRGWWYQLQITAIYTLEN